MTQSSRIFALTLCLAAVAGAGLAQTAPYKMDPNAPMKFAADGQVLDPGTCVSTLSGRAEFDQDRTRLRANTVTMTSAKNGKACGEIQRLEAKGEVFYVTPDRTVRADNAVYEQKSKIVTFTGNVITVQGKNVSVADRIVYDTDTTATQMSGHVQTVYYPEQDDGPFRGADANKDGKLDRAEFAVALDAKRNPPGLQQTAQPAPRNGTVAPAPGNDAATQFTRYDANRDGFVSLDEWKYPPAAGPAR